jgi:hypothetical protein
MSTALARLCPRAMMSALREVHGCHSLSGSTGNR